MRDISDEQTELDGITQFKNRNNSCCKKFWVFNRNCCNEFFWLLN